jgi:hypothetical protein
MPMQITLNDLTHRELTEVAHYCSLPPDKLAQLFVEDGLRLYRREPNEFKSTVVGEDQ